MEAAGGGGGVVAMWRCVEGTVDGGAGHWGRQRCRSTADTPLVESLDTASEGAIYAPSGIMGMH